MDSIEYLAENISIVDKRVMQEVVIIIQEVFEDFELDEKLSFSNVDGTMDGWTFL